VDNFAAATPTPGVRDRPERGATLCARAGTYRRQADDGAHGPLDSIDAGDSPRAPTHGRIEHVTSSEIPSVPVAEVPGAFDTPAPSADPPAILLDVREDDEWRQGHAPGAIHIPMMDVPARLDELDYDSEIYVICRQGGRSIEVAGYLAHVGFEVVQCDGGMVAWQQAGRPLVAEGDGQAKIY